LHGGEEACVGE
jgi:hypothetical protein